MKIFQKKIGMIQRAYGKIINIASVMSFLGGITIPAYAASKGGVAQLKKHYLMIGLEKEFVAMQFLRDVLILA